MKKTFLDRPTKRQIVCNAKKAALRDGYDQIVFIGFDGDYGFTRLVSGINPKDFCLRLVGFVEKVAWHYTEANFYDADSKQDKDVSKLNELSKYYNVSF